jgi:hypothetical protein
MPASGKMLSAGQSKLLVAYIRKLGKDVNRSERRLWQRVIRA